VRRRVRNGLIALLLGCAARTKADELAFVEAVGQDGVLNGAVAAVVSGDGGFVYVAAEDDDAIGVFARDAASGALTFISVVRDGVDGVDGLDGAGALALSSDGAFLYAAGAADDALAVFSRDAQTGGLTEIQTLRDEAGAVDGLDGVEGIALSPDGRSLYASASFDFSLAAFDRDPATGLLSFVRERSFEFDGGLLYDIGNADGVGVGTDGTTVYVGSTSGDRMYGFARDAATSDVAYADLAWLSSLQQPLGDPAAIAPSPDGRHLYVGAADSRAISIFGIGADGVLDPLGFVPDGAGGMQRAGAQGLAFEATGRRLYAATRDPGGVTVHARDPATGALTFLEAHVGTITPGVFLGDGGELALSPDARHLYVPDASGQVLVFAVAPEPARGALAACAIAALAAVRRARFTGAAS
jgi:6-phosphogluconolactonase (cycloisomerase 2 family)